MEVAGVVLGSLPLLTTALSDYQTGIKKLHRTVKYDNELKKLIRSVKEQKILFQDNLQKLVNAASPSSTEIRDVADNYSEELWSGKLASDVRGYLGEDRHELFEETAKEFEQCLLELASELDHVQRKPKDKKKSSKPRDTPMTLSDLKPLAIRSSQKANFFTKRVHFLIREDEVARLARELNGLNLSMDKLLDNSRTLHQHVESHIITDVRGASALAALLQQVRERADRMFHALHRTWASGCHSAHEAMIYLDTPVAYGQARTVMRQASSSQFRLLVRGKSGDKPCLPCWHETIVTVEEVDEANASQAQPSQPDGLKKTPAIATPTPDPSSAQMQIENLCKDIQKARSAQKSLDLILYETFVSKDATHWPACAMPLDDPYEVINLEQLMSRRRRILPASKVSVALKLAASLLQFKTTQWLHAWTNTAIQFFHHRAANTIDVEQPLIAQIFDPPEPGLGTSVSTSSSCATLVPESPPQPTPRRKKARPERRPRPMFLELGILLMEIWTQRTYTDWLEEYREEGADDDIDVEDMARAELALAWYDEASDYMTVRYGKVVLTCLNFAFELDQGLPSWDDRNLRVAVCAKIIQPLREECETFPDRKGRK